MGVEFDVDVHLIATGDVGLLAILCADADHEHSAHHGDGVAFTVAPERQQEVVDLLTQAAEGLMRRQPGFVSVSIHRSADGRRIVNYVQWRSREDFEALSKNRHVQPHFARVGALVQFDPIVYEVAHVSNA